MSELTKIGQEVFDQTPVEFPIHFDRPIPLHIRIRQQILSLQQEMRNQSEFDTPEEADDFDMPEDSEMWNSPYEVDFDHINEDKSNAEPEPENKAEPKPDTKAEPEA